MSSPEEKICEQCGAPFRRMPAHRQAAWEARRFCGSKCARDFRSAKVQERNVLIIRDLRSGMLQVEVAEKYGVVPAVISDIAVLHGLRRRSGRKEPLTADRVRQLLSYDPETGVFHWRRPKGRSCEVGKPAGNIESCGYRRIMVDGHRCLAHRLAWFYVYGEWPSGDLDHKNGFRDDNRIGNLRPATKKQNSANTKPKNPVGLKGAVWNRFCGYWQSYIRIDGKSQWLGRFDTAEEAHAAYMAAARKVHGEYVRGTI